MKSPRKPIRKVSSVRARQLREYRKLKADFLLANPICFACKKVVAEGYRDLHHVFGRVGRLLCWTPGFRTVHSDCHQWIHDHPESARMIGLLADLGQWNDYDRAVEYEKTRRATT